VRTADNSVPHHDGRSSGRVDERELRAGRCHRESAPAHALLVMLLPAKGRACRRNIEMAPDAQRVEMTPQGRGADCIGSDPMSVYWHETAGWFAPCREIEERI
jgi:hypothetical protein